MSTIDRQAILEVLSRLVTPGIKLTALADELGARKHEYAELREIIFDLVEDGTIHVITGGAFALAPSGRPGDHLRPRGGRHDPLHPRRRVRARALGRPGRTGPQAGAGRQARAGAEPE